MQNLENIVENSHEERRKTGWPATILYYSALVPYFYGGARLMENMATSESKVQEALFPLAFMGYVAGVFVLREAFQGIANLIRKYNRISKN